MTKICPHCQKRYSDVSFEFCLEDGTRLMHFRADGEDEPETRFGASSTFSGTSTASPTNNRNTISADWKTLQNQNTIVSNPADKPLQTDSPEQIKSFADANQTSPAQQKLVQFAENKAAAIIAVALALAHNYWQWLYLARPGNFEITTFLVWLVLLATGAATAMLVLKFGRSGKGYAIIGLILLGINLLLYLVPRK